MTENIPSENRFGAVIRSARQAKGLTQKQLAELCGYAGSNGEAFVRKWELDKSPVPITCLRRLCAALDLPLDALIP